MVAKKPPQEPDNPITDKGTPIKCDVIIRGIRRTILEVDWPHIELHNKEFRSSKKKKIKENLDQYLLTPDIIKNFVQQLEGKRLRDEGINKDKPHWKYYGYDKIIDKRNDKKYRILIFLDDECPEFVGVVTAYPPKKFKPEE